MTDPRDYKIDGLSQATPNEGTPAKRPYIGVRFACCNVYVRIYRSADGKHYRGGCPRCGVPVSFVVGEGGTDARTFVVR